MLHTLLLAALGTAFLFLMTTLGAATVFFLARESGERTQRVLLGFAAGVMTAASVWSLLLPALAQTAEDGRLPPLLPAAAGMLGGAAFLLGLDALCARREGTHGSTLLLAAITLHNIPEGMAVGLAFALAGVQGGLAAAAVLALGIGVQNLPEGLAVALPFRASGLSRGQSFAGGALSGAVEPVFGMLAALMMGAAQSALPGMMAFCAGAMMQVVFAEMIPQAAKTRAGVAGVMAGYTLMMALDLALG